MRQYVDLVFVSYSALVTNRNNFLKKKASLTGSNIVFTSEYCSQRSITVSDRSKNIENRKKTMGKTAENVRTVRAVSQS